MTITDIDHKIIDFQMTTGRRPTTVYLGQTEYKELLEWAREFSNASYPEGNDKVHYQGCAIYEVVTEHHFRVS